MTVVSQLASLEASGLIRLAEVQPELEYLFRHALIQEAAYASLLKADRRVLHRAVAETLERLYPERLDELSALLAYHYRRAETPDKARHYFLMAAVYAQARYANEDALHYYTDALTLTPEEALAQRYDIVLAREDVYNVYGAAREAQAHDLDLLAALADQLDDDRKRAEAAVRRARHALQTTQYAATIVAAQNAVALAHKVGAVDHEANACLYWGGAQMRRGDNAEAQKVFERALTLAQAARLPQLEADALLCLGLAKSGGAVGINALNLAEVRAYYEQALGLYRELGNLHSEAKALMNLGNVAAQQSDYDRALAYYEQALLCFHQMGAQAWEGQVLQNIGFNALQQGDLGQARSHLLRALRFHRGTESRESESALLCDLARLCFYQADLVAAQEYARQALQIARDTNYRALEGFALTNLGHCLLAQGQLSEAAEAYESAYTLRQELGEADFAVESLAGLAAVLLAQGHGEPARACVEKILARIEMNVELGVEDLHRVYLTCYRVLREGDASDAARARSVLETGYQTLQVQAARITNEAMRRLFLRNIPSHLELIAEWQEAAP